MKHSITVAALASLLVALPSRASSQQPVASTSGEVKAADAAPLDSWSLSPVGKYDVILDIPDRGVTHVNLDIWEENGKLSAMFWPVGDHDGHVMSVAVKGVDMILSAQAPGGLVEIKLEHRGKNLSGSWSMGEQHGPLSGSVKG